MQSDSKEIYKKTTERTGEDEQIYKDIGNTVFASLNAHLRKPPSLIMKLRGIGTWYLRKKRMQIIVDLFPPNFEKKPEDFESDYGITQYENKVELYKLFKDRLLEYDKYIEIRNNIREIRRKTQVLLQPNKDED